MCASGASAAIDVRCCWRRVCRRRNHREHQRFSARCASILPQPQRRDAPGRAGPSWRIHLAGTWRKARSLRRQEGACSRGGDFLEIKSCGGEPREIELSNGEKIISSTLVWTAGTSPNPILDLVACPRE